jgi:maltose alpha-D-glucosyltransferase/alpha-amylase
MKSHQPHSPLWYKEAVIYEVHVKSFFDSNRDGIGDIRGLTQKLDYLQDLGATAIWVLPFYPSPLRDDGYDIADYYSINPDYGSLEDFQELLREAHRREIKVITELVINHTSDQHQWFQRSRRAPAGSADRELYVWSDSPEKYEDARIIFQDFEASNWTWDSVAKAYYWHRFYSHQPDLNFDNPVVQEEIFKVMEFWLDMGVDGMRLDAIPYLFEREKTNCENLPETHAFLKELRARIDAKYTDRMLLAEANQWPEDSVEYFGDGDECHMSFHFPLMPRIFMSMQMEDRFPIIDILEQTPEIPETAQWALFLRNHDELTLEMVTDEERDYMYRMYARDPRSRINLGIRRRLAPLLGNDRRKIELANVLLFSMPGTPVLYYGDEIGMGDNYYLGDRDGVRTPMQWSPDRNAGFSLSNPQSLYLPVIIDPEYHFEGVNVENQQHNPSSLFWWTKRLIVTRKRMKAFAYGELDFLQPENSKVLAFTRKYEEQTLLVVMNLSRNPQAVQLDLSGMQGCTPIEVFGRNRFPVVTEEDYNVTLGPWDYFWFEMEPAQTAASGLAKLKEYTAQKDTFEPVFSTKGPDFLSKSLLPYIKQSPWYQDSSRPVDETSIIDRVPIGHLDNPEEIIGLAVLVELSFTEGNPAVYAVILGAVPQRSDEEGHPAGAVASIQLEDKHWYIVDAEYHADLLVQMSASLQSQGPLAGQGGQIKAKLLIGAEELQSGNASIAGSSRRNTALSVDNEFLIKYYRRIEPVVNPEQEILAFLGEAKEQSLIPQYLGTIEFQGKDGRNFVLALAQKYVQHESDGWTFASDSALRSLEQLQTREVSLEEIQAAQKSLAGRFTLSWKDVPELALLEPHMLSFAETLGRSTAEMHMKIAGSERTEFRPEPFSKLYQRSLYQSFQSQVRRVGKLIDSLSAKDFAGDLFQDIKKIRSLQERTFQELRRIAGDKLPAYKIRVHNDYHLGQVLWTGREAVIIDFEGRTDVPFSERRLKRPAIGDAADMMRSFHYASYHALEHSASSSQEALAWADLWYHCASGLFLSAYIDKMAGAGWLSKEPDQREAILIPLLLQRMYQAMEYHLQKGEHDHLLVSMHGIFDLLGAG